MTTEIFPRAKTLIIEEPLVLHTYASRCWRDVRLSDMFRLKLDRERNDWHEFIGHFSGSCDESAK